MTKSSPPARPIEGRVLVASLLSILLLAASAFPSELAGMVWLPSGVAAVSTAVFGWRGLWPALLVTVGVNAAWLGAMPDLALPQYFGLLANLALGGAAQLLLARRLLRPVLLRGGAGSGRDLARLFLGLALPGFASFVPNAVAYSLVLGLPVSKALAGALVWWIGDAAGGLLAGPVAAAYLAEPADIWRPRRSMATVAFVLGWGVLAPSLWVAGERLDAFARDDWEGAAAARSAEILDRLDRGTEAIAALRVAASGLGEPDKSGKTDDPEKPEEIARAAELILADLPEAARPLLLAFAPAAGPQPQNPSSRLSMTAGAGSLPAQAWRGVSLGAIDALRPTLARALAQRRAQVAPAPAAFGAPPGSLLFLHPVTTPPRGVEGETALTGLIVGVLAPDPLAPPVAPSDLLVSRCQSELRLDGGAPGGPILAADCPAQPDPVGMLLRPLGVSHEVRYRVLGLDVSLRQTATLRLDLFEPPGLWAALGLFALFIGAGPHAIVLLLAGRELVVVQAVEARTRTLETIRSAQSLFIASDRADQAAVEAIVRALWASRGTLDRQAQPCATCPLAHLCDGATGTPPGPCAPSRDTGEPGRPSDHIAQCQLVSGVRPSPTGTLLQGATDPPEVRALVSTLAAMLDAHADAAERREAERRLHTFLTFLPIQAYMKDLDGRYLFVNPAFERTLRWTGQTCVGQRDAELWPPAVAAALAALDARCVQPEDAQLAEVELPTHHGMGRFRLHSVRVQSPGGQIYLAGMAVDFTAEHRHAAALEGSLVEKEALLKEIHHRVKNNLQIVSSLLSLQRGEQLDPQVVQFLDESRARIRSIALLHETLYQSGNLARIDLHRYVASLAALIARTHAARAGGVRLVLSVDPIELPLDAAIPCGLIVNELLTNAYKHAFPDGRGGSVTVEIRDLGPASPGHVQLRVADDGVGPPQGFDPKKIGSLGVRLIGDLTRQLDGETRFAQPASGGLEVLVSFPTGPTHRAGAAPAKGV